MGRGLLCARRSRSGLLLLLRLAVARLGRLLLLGILVARLLLLGILIARLLSGISGARKGVALRRLLRITGGSLLTWIGVQTVAAAILAVALRWVVIAGGVTPVEKTTRHFTHALAKLRQKLQRAFIVCRWRRLLIAVALRLLLVALRCGLAVLLRITTLLLGIIALLSLC